MMLEQSSAPPYVRLVIFPQGCQDRANLIGWGILGDNAKCHYGHTDAVVLGSGPARESTDQHILGWFLGNSHVACYVQKDLEDTLQTEPFLWNLNSGENLDLVRVKMK